MTAFAADIWVDKTDFDRDMTLLAARMSDPGLLGFMNAMVEPYIKTRIESRFMSEGDDVTGAWASLSPATEEIRQNQGFPPAHPINRRTGQMMAFLTGSSSDTKINGAFVQLTHPGPTTSHSLEEKIKTAQQGRATPNTRPRPVLGLNINDEIFIIGFLAAYLLGP